MRNALLTSLDVAVKQAEDKARVITTAGVQQVLALGKEHLPVSVEHSCRVFMPEAMFSTHRSRDGKHKIHHDSLVVDGSTAGLGISLTSCLEMGQPTVFDLFNVPHYFWVYFEMARRTARMRVGPVHSGSCPSVLVWSQ